MLNIINSDDYINKIKQNQTRGEKGQDTTVARWLGLKKNKQKNKTEDKIQD